MTKQQKAIALLEKERNKEVIMMNNMSSYIDKKDKRYNKLKRNHIERIDLLDYIIMRIR